ncbi:MAG: polymer-forming cytoskeletal protein, partial [bacterium]|nr:polymer-forming cytoskeletal protein [bacterium]
MADQSSRRFTDQSGTTSTVIGKGIHVKGEITGSAPIEVWGSIEGKAGTEGLFWVREGGKVGGEIAATNIVVEGQVDGTISAKDKAELRSSCKVEGNVTAKTVA